MSVCAHCQRAGLCPARTQQFIFVIVIPSRLGLEHQRLVHILHHKAAVNFFHTCALWHLRAHSSSRHVTIIIREAGIFPTTLIPGPRNHTSLLHPLSACNVYARMQFTSWPQNKSFKFLLFILLTFITLSIHYAEISISTPAVYNLAKRITQSHGSASVVRVTTAVNGEMGNSTPCHAQTP